MARIALGIEYDGSAFHGWQSQKTVPTIQSTVEKALSRIADSAIPIYCAGRTDAGVHATGQVVHFETDIVRSLQAWTVGTNTYLPNTISIRWAEEVDNHFHARFSALSRCYRYIIYNHAIRSALLDQRTTWYPYYLDEKKMQLAANYLLGEQDFSSFRAAQCDAKTPMRCVQFCQVSRLADRVVIDIQANAFLHHMVRNIAGVLMRIGAGFEEPEWMQYVLFAKDRRAAAETAPASGLYLTKVNYSSQYIFPENIILLV